MTEDPTLQRALQVRLVEAGIALDWHIDVGLEHPAFAACQLLSTWTEWPADPDRLEFRPEEPMDPTEAAALIRERNAPLAPRVVAALPERPTRADLAIAWLGALRQERD